MNDVTHITLPTRLNHALEDCLRRAALHFGRAFAYEKVVMNLRGRAAGQIRYGRRGDTLAELRFNAALLERYGQAFIDEVVPHEVAHLVAYSHYGTKIRPHGKEWQYVMCEVLGQKEARVTHQFQTENARTVRYFDYRCSCPDTIHRLSAIRHGKVSRRKARYQCRRCGEPLYAVAS